MYKVIKFFTDLHDDHYPYNVGDTFPRERIAVTEERLKELAGKENKQGEPLIQPIEDDEPEHEVTAADSSVKRSTAKKRGTKTSAK